MISSSFLVGFLAVTTIVFFAAWSRERDKRADFETDLHGAIVRGQITSNDLRRSLRHKSIRKACEKQNPKARARYNNDARSRGNR